jgi:hypothetical protein
VTFTLPFRRHEARHAAPVTGILDARRALLMDLAREAYPDNELAVGGRLRDLTHGVDDQTIDEAFDDLIRAVRARHACYEAAHRASGQPSGCVGTHMLAARRFGEQADAALVRLTPPPPGSSWSKAAAAPVKAMVAALEAGDPHLFGGAR